ncbi:hypothetical protein O181_044363 [Austropuccinia psidii MF-1]|uniref:Uncharacterized protein n=1 Tax=Austropuccinia psidii MF-1 TaxID=1389203 RepID=A0A9Q3DN70_9BASI|nr:hypothetical protein [Austropuccinia psidii MF-1]
MLQTYEGMVRRYCAYVLGVKDCDGFTHYLCTLLLALEIAYKTSVHASNNQIPAMIKQGWNSRLAQDSLRKDLAEKHPTVASFKGMK